MSTHEPAKWIVWRDVVAMIALLVGSALVALSFIWPKVSAGRSGWTDELATRYQAASAKVHQLSMQAGSTPPESQTRALQEDLAEAQAEYGTLREELEVARAKPARVASILFYSGIAIAVGGVIALAVRRNA